MASHQYNLLEHFLFPPTSLNLAKLKTACYQKTILITGASFGIGATLTKLLAQTEAQLILVARTADKLQELQASLTQQKASIQIIPTDLTQTQQVEHLVQQIKALPQGLDLVISNAGHSIYRPLQASLERFHDFQRTMNINYFAPVQLLLPLIPLLAKKQGQIINISAINVLLLPAPHWAAYQASKAAFDQWFRCAGPELATSNIRCTSIYLPLVKTRMIAPTKAYDKMPAMQPQHVAKIIAKSIYTKHRKFAPWWLFFGQLGSLLFRGPWEFFTPYFLKKR